MKKLLFLIIFILSNISYAQENIESFDNKNVPVLNDQLQNTGRKIYDLESTRATTTALNAKFSTTTGHDHDGTDSKKVVVTNLDTTGTAPAELLYNNAGTIDGIQATGLVVGTYVFSYQAAVSDDLEIISTSLTDSTYTPTYRYFRVSEITTPTTILTNKWEKELSINTIRIDTQLWENANNADSLNPVLTVTVGTQSTTITAGNNVTSPTWYSGSLDVESLTPDVLYDITIQLSISGVLGGQPDIAYAGTIMLSGDN